MTPTCIFAQQKQRVGSAVLVTAAAVVLHQQSVESTGVVCLDGAGEPAWNRSESRKQLHLEQLQLEALANSSTIGGPQPIPGTLDYEHRKQERLQAIK